MRDLTVLLPAMDEAECIADVAMETLAACAAAGIDAEVLVVDDGSTDDTAAIARALGRATRRVRVVSLPRNLGRAHAIARGLREVDGRAVAIMDADGQYDPADLGPMLAVLDDGADMVNGRRVARADSAWRRFVSVTYNAAVMRVPLGVAVPDANSGLKMIRTDALDRLAFDPTGFHRGHRFLVAWAVRRGLVVESVDIGHRRRAGGRSYIRVPREARYTLTDLAVFRRRVRRAPAGVGEPLERSA